MEAAFSGPFFPGSISPKPPVQSSAMKRLLCLLLLLGTFGSAFGSGLIILHDDTFWRYPEPPFVPPLPHPRPRPPSPAPSWMPIELSSRSEEHTSELQS